MNGLSKKKKHKLLFVDDNTDFLKSIKVMLRKIPAELFLVESGLKAVELTKKVKPDIVFMDLRMPKISGWKVVEKIKKEKHLKHVKIIILTNYDKEIEPGYDEHKDLIKDYILKIDLNKTLLQDIIQRYLK